MNDERITSQSALSTAYIVFGSTHIDIYADLSVALYSCARTGKFVA
jgi:hypothetical protein